MNFRTVGISPRATPLDGLKITKSVPGDPHYPEPGTMNIDRRSGLCYIRDDEYAAILEKLRRVSANDAKFEGGQTCDRS